MRLNAKMLHSQMFFSGFSNYSSHASFLNIGMESFNHDIIPKKKYIIVCIDKKKLIHVPHLFQSSP